MINEIFSELDFLLLPIYFIIFYILGNRIKASKIIENKLYAYYTRGLIFKLCASVMVSLIFLYYYKGGDNIGYFWSAQFLAKMQTLNPNVFFSVLANNRTPENLGIFFDNGLCCPDYWKDSQSFTVVRVCSLFVWLSGNNFLTTGLIFAWLSYGGIFRLFLLFNELFPGMEKKFAIAILYMPSVIFWGSSILKDTITFSASCWMIFAFYNLAIKPKKPIRNLVILILSAFIIISIKPYIFVAFLPGITLWAAYFRILKIKSAFFRLVLGPGIILVGVVISAAIFVTFSKSFGEYGSIDAAVNKAVVTKNDLTRAEYGKNSFDIGKIDGSVSGLLSKFPAAVIAGLFRPFLWDASNPIMLFSALENTFLLLMFLRVFFKNGLQFFPRIFGNPVLVLSFVFSIFFAFALGITTANFGALVRYKIPAIPFFLSMLYILDRPQSAFTLKEPESTESTQNELVEAQ
jgi:hypothetical protein